jgi:hypothetical protein
MLMTLGLAFSLLGTTSAFARPNLHFENDGLSNQKKTVESHVPTAKTSGATGYVRRPPANAVKDNWPNRMILG